MRSELGTNDRWLRNFKNSLNELMEESKQSGYLVQGIVMTVGIYDKLSAALGYDPTDFLGYTIEILDQTEEEFAEEGEMVFVKQKPLQ